jgi:DNA-binding response OmpR family regulator
MELVIDTSEVLGTLDDTAAFGPRSVKPERSGLASILYVEDDPTLRRLSTLALTRPGYTVQSVEDGVQAWEALHSDSFDLLITDNEMPRLTGLELVTKARLEGINLPIILASGSANILGSADYQRLRFAARLQKPFGSTELLKTVEYVLHCVTSTPQRDDRLSQFAAESLRWVNSYRHGGINE